MTQINTLFIKHDEIQVSNNIQIKNIQYYSMTFISIQYKKLTLLIKKEYKTNKYQIYYLIAKKYLQLTYYCV